MCYADTCLRSKIAATPLMKTWRTIQVHAIVAVGLVACTLVCGCYSTRRIGVEDLSRTRNDGTYRLSLSDGIELRVRVSPIYAATRAAIGCRRTAFDAANWKIRYGGFPAVYRSGRSWRQEAVGEVVQIPTSEIVSASVEEFDWIRTTLASPILLPAGLVDFIADNAKIGFDAVNDRFDSFSRPPRSVAGPPTP